MFFLLIIGKPPQFEVRHMDANASISANSMPVPERHATKEPVATSNDYEDAEDMHIEDVADDSFDRVKKLRNSRSESSTRRVYVYTYKVTEAA